MDRVDLSVLLFTLLIFTATVLLIAAGESRPDTYLAVAILIYFVHTIVDNSIRSRASMKITDIALVVIFIAIVSIRILIILGIIQL